jgi:YesN/AraC family two-component response regulator
MHETRILIIDDVAEIHANIRSIFELRPSDKLEELTKDLFGATKAPHPYRDRLESLVIDSAYQGEEGYEMVKVARAEGRPYSVALVDMRMPPGWDGLETIKKIREIEADTEIIICSAYSDYSWHEIAAELGANDKYLFLSKPFELTEMKQMVMNLSEKFSLHEKHREALEVLKKANAAAESSAQAKQEFLSIIGHEQCHPPHA